MKRIVIIAFLAIFNATPASAAESSVTSPLHHLAESAIDHARAAQSSSRSPTLQALSSPAAPAGAAPSHAPASTAAEHSPSPIAHVNPLAFLAAMYHHSPAAFPPAHHPNPARATMPMHPFFGFYSPWPPMPMPLPHPGFRELAVPLLPTDGPRKNIKITLTHNGTPFYSRVISRSSMPQSAAPAGSTAYSVPAAAVSTQSFASDVRKPKARMSYKKDKEEDGSSNEEEDQIDYDSSSDYEDSEKTPSKKVNAAPYTTIGICPHCNTTEPNIYRHVKSDHSKKLNFVCTVGACHRRFRSELGLKIHTTKTHK